MFDMINSDNNLEVKYFWCSKRCRNRALIDFLERHVMMTYIETMKSRSLFPEKHVLNPVEHLR